MVGRIRWQRIARNQRTDVAVEAEEERLAQREACGNVDPVDREQVAQLHLARMILRIIVQADGVGIEQRARVCGQRVPLPLRRAARVEQVVGVVDRRAVLPAAHRDDILQGGKIVLAVRDRDAIGDVGVGLAVDVRNAEIVADDFGGVGAVSFGWGALGGEKRFPGHQADRDDQQQHCHYRAGPLENANHAGSPSASSNARAEGSAIVASRTV